MALGAHNARIGQYGFTHAWANDMDRDGCESLITNLSISKSSVYCCKVENLDFEKLASIDGLVFGFPCNNFSVIGNRQGIKGEFGRLYLWGVKALVYFKPSFFVAENVSGLKFSGGKKDFKVILQALQDAGYDIFPHLYKFEEYGVPQNRHRILIVGFRSDLKIPFEHPKPTHSKNLVSAEQALSNIPADSNNNELTKQSKQVVERLKYIKLGENAFTADIPEHLCLKLKSKATISQIYRRLIPDSPSYTITGSGGGGTHVYHWKEHRALTNRERARLQTFPDSYHFKGGKESVRRQIGMAVPPMGAQIIFRSVLKALLDSNVAMINPSQK